MPFGFGIGLIATDNIANGAVTNAKVAAAAAIGEAKINPNPGTHAAAAAPHSGHAVAAAQSYTGNAAVNRAIAHGLGRVPKSVVIVCTDATYFSHVVLTPDGYATGVYANAPTMGRLAVTPFDATNFYVGNATNTNFAGNTNAFHYEWVAVG